ncbi:MAG: hypothetical protein OFPII_22580 [Osedax symbiont Rs1]|nr:MAG: hypothetical protein OFPII_22580 [Osedax symbiont Rs1]
MAKRAAKIFQRSCKTNIRRSASTLQSLIPVFKIIRSDPCITLRAQ